MRGGLAPQAPESHPDSAKGVRDPHTTRRANTHPWRPRLLGNRPPSGGGAGRSRNLGEEGGSCTAPATQLRAHRPSGAGSNRHQPPGKGSAKQEFEGKLARVTSGAGGGLGDSGARGPTPGERGRREACACRALSGRGLRRQPRGRGRACASRNTSSRQVVSVFGVVMVYRNIEYHRLTYFTVPFKVLTLPPIWFSPHSSEVRKSVFCFTGE